MVFLSSSSSSSSSIPFPSLSNKSDYYYSSVEEVQMQGTTIQPSFQYLFHQSQSDTKFRMRRRRGQAILASNLESSSSNSKPKIANLSARRKERVTLPYYSDESRQMYSISEFLSHPSGVETMLNTKALQRFEPLDSNTYRCTLHSIQLLNFEVAPVLDLRVTPTSKDCTVEMLSCEFEGSQAVKHHNDRFSAFMRNHITWEANCSEPCLDVDVNLNISLEIYTLPFTMLPISAVEKPGNLIMQALVDKLVPLLIQQLLQDYEKWVREQCEVSP